MPTVRHKPPIRQITRQLDRLIDADGRDLEYMGLGFLVACYEFKTLTRLSWVLFRGFLQACEFIEYRGDVSKTSLHSYLRLKYDKASDELPEQIAAFFFRDPETKRYTLSPAGIQARAEWTTTLRRVLLDEKERYRLLYDRWNKEEILRRKKAKRFFELATDEQIRIARAFFAMPRTTEEDRHHVQAARRYLYMNFDVRPNDLKTLAKQYPVIQTAKHMPTPPAQGTGPEDLETTFRRPEHYRKADQNTNTDQQPDT